MVGIAGLRAHRFTLGSSRSLFPPIDDADDHCPIVDLRRFSFRLGILSRTRLRIAGYARRDAATRLFSECRPINSATYSVGQKKGKLRERRAKISVKRG